MKRNTNVGFACLWTFSIVIAVIMLASCKSNYHKCDAYGKVKWENSVCNPENGDFVAEVAFNEDCTAEEVTQEQFDNRYSKGY